MATEKSFQLYINEDNVKQYFSASGGALNGAAIGGKYITMRTSSTTATFTMNDAGRDVLFPSVAAKAHKIDVWAQAIATLSNSKNTINVAIAGQDAITTERISTSLTEYSGSVSRSFTKSDTTVIYTIKIANGFHAAGVRDTSITAYFTQYSCMANAAGKGIKSVSVSNTSPYEGEIVAFYTKLHNGANFEGWFSDEACTQQVSASLTYSTAAADLTLYAKATIEAEIYTCDAVAGENITSASVNESSVVSGDSVTFTAQINEGCLFDGWYSDSSYSTLVSTSNPYTTPVTSNITLYAKASKKQFTMTVGAAEHGAASASASIVSYGDNVTFTFTPEDETWELYGWYSDSGLTNLVSEANPYTFMAVENVSLYPKVGKKRYTITLQTKGTYIRHGATTLSMIAVDPMLLTEEDYRNLRSGNFEAIQTEKILDSAIKTGHFTTSYSATIAACKGSILALYAEAQASSSLVIDDRTTYFLENDIKISNGPHYITTIIGEATYEALSSGSLPYRSECMAIALDGIEYAEVYPKTVEQGSTTTFEATLLAGYKFEGWYSDADGSILVSAENPVQITTPTYTGDEAITTLTLYAKATKVAAGTGLYMKVNSSYIEATVIYKKANGVWTATDKTAIDTTKNYRVIH